ncbi:MAG: hypothetical protein WBN62_12550, partial [Thermoanaerobaculia bacterium]
VDTGSVIGVGKGCDVATWATAHINNQALPIWGQQGVQESPNDLTLAQEPPVLLLHSGVKLLLSGIHFEIRVVRQLSLAVPGSAFSRWLGRCSVRTF